MTLKICSQNETSQFAPSKKLCGFENRMRSEIVDFGQPCPEPPWAHGSNKRKLGRGPIGLPQRTMAQENI